MARKTTIVAIDDEKDILYMLKAIGDTQGWTVHGETNSLVAVSKIRTIKPDLILIDYHMPQQNGVTTVRQIRNFNAKVPIIVLTIDDRQAIANEFLEAGASDFANKPIRVPDLVARINVHFKLLEQQRAMNGRTLVNKGINEATLQMVADECCALGDWFYIEQVAQNLGLAYQTTVRYLQYLVAKDELLVVNDYGKVGRPRNKYKYSLPAVDKDRLTTK